mgnify:CR=1 FL=1
MGGDSNLKKLRPVFLFIAGSLIILVIFSFFYWNYSQDNPESIQHVRLEEWSQPVAVAGNLPMDSYDTLFTEEEFSLFTTAEDNNERIIKQTTLSFNGQVQEEIEVARAGHAGFPQVISYSGNNYLFYFAGPGSVNQSLMMKDLSSEDSPVALRENISYPNSLSVAEAEGSLVLAYIEKEQESGQNAISILGYNDLNREPTFYHTHIFDKEIRYSQMATIEDKVMLSWHERNPETMFISSQEDKFNRYLLKIGQLDLDTGEIESTVELGEAFGNNQANIDTFKYNDQLWISWAVYDRDVERNLINIGYLNDGEDYQEFTRISGFNPALYVNDEETTIINSRNLRMRGQAGLFINNLAEDDDNPKIRRMFPSLNFSSAPEIIDHEEGRHLFWTEAASSGSDIYYSNTVEAEPVGLIEFMGFNTIDSPIELVSSLAIYFAYPIPAIQFMLGYSIIPLLILVLIIYLSRKKFTEFYNLSQDTPYVSFIGAVIAMSGIAILMQGNINDLFTYNLPPSGQSTIIFIVVTLVSLGFIYFLEYDKGHSFYIGLGTFIIWLYWLSQAALVYNFHSFFI